MPASVCFLLLKVKDLPFLYTFCFKFTFFAIVTSVEVHTHISHSNPKLLICFHLSLPRFESYIKICHMTGHLLSMASLYWKLKEGFKIIISSDFTDFVFFLSCVLEFHSLQEKNTRRNFQPMNMIIFNIPLLWIQSCLLFKRYLSALTPPPVICPQLIWIRYILLFDKIQDKTVIRYAIVSTSSCFRI